jgi:hypothetical protein
VLAESELGIESEKIVFLLFNKESEIAFKDTDYRIFNVNNYLNSKM